MNYDEIDVDQIVNEVSVAVAQGNYRNATEKETMAVRLAALNAIAKRMPSDIENDTQKVPVTEIR
jgi:hypothetical protein